MSLYDEQLQRLKVRATETRDSGVWVKVLDSNRTGYIKRKEIAWERRVGVIPKMPQTRG